MEDWLPNRQGFYDSRQHHAVGDKRRSSTIDLALRIRDAGGLTPTRPAQGSAPLDPPAGVSASLARSAPCRVPGPGAGPNPDNRRRNA
jgi:hypothetical protein